MDDEKARLLNSIRVAIENASRYLTTGDQKPDIVLQQLKRSSGTLKVLRDLYELGDVDKAELEYSLSELQTEIEDRISKSKEEVKFKAQRLKNGQPGRPQVIIPREHLQMFHDFGYTAQKMASHFNCSSSLVYRRLHEEGISQRQKYSNISDHELDSDIEKLHNLHPNTGSTMMAGFLEASGLKVQRKRVRVSLRRIDPASCEKRCRKTAKRRVYSVESPNSLWHIDGHMKLIRWGISTHGGIDGFSRLITYLSCSSDNKASTVLRKFVPACARYGVPALVRSDCGRENLLVGLFMNLVNRDRPNNIIAGRSIHNQRIERLWRDVFEQVIHEFYKLFYDMEDEGIINVNCEEELICLRFVFIPIIQSRLERFRIAWNKHKLRTENNRSPEEVWFSGVLDNLHSSSTAVTNIFNTDSLETTLQNSLQHFQLNIDNFPDYEEERPFFSQERTEELNMVISVPEDLREKYNRCLHLMRTQ